MIAIHHTEVSLHNTENIRASQLEETSQDLYLVVSLTIPLTRPPCMALSHRRTVWCLRNENKDGAHTHKKGILAVGATYRYGVVWQQIIMHASPVWTALTVYLCTASLLLTLLWLPLLSLLSPSFHSSALTFPIPHFSCPLCLLHLCNPSPSSLSQPPLFFISFYLLSPFPLTLPYPLASLPSALLFSTFEASLVSASPNKL